jgi:hypothetical protein
MASDKQSQQLSRLSIAATATELGGLLLLGIGLLFELPFVGNHDLGALGVVIFGLSLVLQVASTLGYLVPRLLSVSIAEGSWLGTVILLGGTIFIVAGTFGWLCHDLFLQFGGFTGLPNAELSKALNYHSSVWLNFSFSWLLDSLTFNASQVGGWVQTSIHPTAWWSAALVVAFSFISDVFLFGSLITVGRATLDALRQGKWRPFDY